MFQLNISQLKAISDFHARGININFFGCRLKSLRSQPQHERHISVSVLPAADSSGWNDLDIAVDGCSVVALSMPTTSDSHGRSDVNSNPRVLGARTFGQAGWVSQHQQ